MRMILTLAALSLASGAAAQKAPPAWARCAMCHNVAKGGPNGVGPNLFGVVGRKPGGVKGYAYSPALKKGGPAWTRHTLDRYIADPQAAAPGGKMPPVPTTPTERQAILTYLAGLK